MADLISPTTISPTFLKPIPTANIAAASPTADVDALRAKAKDAAQKFEGQFLSMMMQQMFQGVSTDGPFGGGFGEEMFRSVMTDAMARKMTQAGGIGLSDTIQREILKLQGLN
jgi:peptidoglycan hydrolase FlgJ